MITCLYQGHLYDLYRQYSSDIVRSHEEFARFNNWDYLVIGDEINNIYGLESWRDTNIDARCDCLGMNKWYAMDWVFENTDYDEILLVDFDSKFIYNTELNLGDCDIKATHLTLSPYYDTTWFLYYCLYKNVPFEQINRAVPFKFNTGFIKVRRGFFQRSDLDEFVDFACRTLNNVKYNERKSWIDMSNADMARIHETHNTTLTPFDEVFLVYQIMQQEPTIEEFDKRFNINSTDLMDRDTAHVHFCVNKERDIKILCEPGRAEFLK